MAEALKNVPKSLFGPLGDDGRILAVICLALAFGLCLKRLDAQKMPGIETVDRLINVAFAALVIVLHWILEVIPLAAFGIVAAVVGTKGFGAFRALGSFVLAVLVALTLQAAYYLIRIRAGSWVRPLHLLRSTRDALVMAFSTGSSTATMPLTYSTLKDRVGLREQSASMGALVGSNFNNDGTALYEAMAALFVAQSLGRNLGLTDQILVVLMSIVASVGAAGIPEAGLVTMTLVFKAVHLPLDYIAMLLTVDWFLDRCRTTVNVMGDMNVACLLDGRTRVPADSGCRKCRPPPRRATCCRRRRSRPLPTPNRPRPHDAICPQSTGSFGICSPRAGRPCDLAAPGARFAWNLEPAHGPGWKAGRRGARHSRRHGHGQGRHDARGGKGAAGAP